MTSDPDAPASEDPPKELTDWQAEGLRQLKRPATVRVRPRRHGKSLSPEECAAVLSWWHGRRKDATAPDARWGG